MSGITKFAGLAGLALGRLSARAIFARAKFREVSNILDALRGPIIVSLIAVVAFAIPGQTREIYWLFAEDFSLQSVASAANLRFLVFIVLLWTTCYVLWYVARILTLANPIAYAALRDNDFDGWVARWGPRWIGAAPAFAAAVGLLRASANGNPFYPESSAAESLLDRVVAEVAVLYVTAAIAVLIGLQRLWTSWRRAKQEADRFQEMRNRLFRPSGRHLVGLAMLAIIGHLMTAPIATTQHMGALSLISLFLIALALGLGVLTFIYDRFAIPVLTLLLLGAFTWSALDTNDNHYIRQRPIPTVQTANGPQPMALHGDTSVREAFRTWLGARADREAFAKEGRPYPVYIIAAQGGGLYAAYQSAIFLTRLQDLCPNFAQHVFGISGVSGGSVGATVFTSLAMRYAKNAPASDAAGCGVAPPDAGSLEDKARDILSQDFLAPLVNGLLFTDFTARFSPTPIRSFDRSRALEMAFEDAWAFTGAATESPLKEGLLSYWRPDAAAPALFINTVEAETGRRLILSPIHNLGSGLRSYAAVAARPASETTAPPPPLDMALSTAMILSARFPYATPAGSLDVVDRIGPDREPRVRKARLVDGGYFENSGIATAADLIRQIEDEAAEQNVDLRVIAFDLTSDAERNPTYALGELLSPIRAILSARSARASVVQAATRRDFSNDRYRSECRYLKAGAASPWPRSEACSRTVLSQSRLWSVSLNDYEYDFELGWILAQETLSRIDQQLGSAGDCRFMIPQRTRGIGGSQTDAEATKTERRKARAERLERSIEKASRTGDGTQLRDYADIVVNLTGEEEAIEIHNSCVADIVADQLRRE